MLVISWFICGMLYFLLYSYLFCKLVCKEKFKITPKLIICSMVLVLIICYINSNKNFEYVRPYITHLFAFILLLFLYRESFVKTILMTLLTMIIVCLSELICGIFMGVLNTNVSAFVITPVGYLLCNILIFICVLLIFKAKIVNKIIVGIIGWYNKNEYKSSMFFLLLCLIIATFLLYNNFIKLLPPFLLVVTNLFCIAVFVFVIGFFKEKTNNNKIIYEYDQLLDYVKVYEKLLEEKSKNQHEYKNQLILIRDTPKKSDRVKYINGILNIENTEQDSEWLRKLKYIPQGGLKGLIYYKIQTMLKNKISVLLTVSEELNDSKKWKSFDKNLSDISKIIGVYLDNAIEATNSVKEKYITISVYLENRTIVFDITNSYKGDIDMNKIDKEGYTTKGIGKGYGLSLVKDIIEKNDCLEQKRTINGMYYTQKLYIKK